MIDGEAMLLEGLRHVGPHPRRLQSNIPLKRTVQARSIDGCEGGIGLRADQNLHD
jgi:hypothetical protein